MTLSRYKRNKDSPPKMVLNNRDLDILETIYAFRFATVEQLYWLFTEKPEALGKYGFGRKALHRRLQKMFHHGYVKRHHYGDIQPGLGEGSSPAIYSLGTKGADLITSDSHEARKIKKVIKNDDVKTPTLRHDVLRSQFRTWLLLAEREGLLRVVRWEQGTYLIIFSKLEDNCKYGIIPDSFYTIQVGDKLLNYFLEVDQSSSKIVPSQYKGTSILKKVKVYWNYRQGIKTGDTDSLFSIKGFRVIFLTKKTTVPDHIKYSRQENIIDAIKENCPDIPKTTNVFRFINEDEIDLANPRKFVDKLYWGLFEKSERFSIIE